MITDKLKLPNQFTNFYSFGACNLVSRKKVYAENFMNIRSSQFYYHVCWLIVI